MPQPRIGVVLINWRNPKDVAKGVDYLQAQSYRKQKIYIVNNGDRDELFRALRSANAAVYNVIEAHRNLGFSGACNLGIHRALADASDYVWLVNTDTRIPTDCLLHLVEDAEVHPEVGLFSPMLYADTLGHPVWVAGGRFDLQDCEFHWFSSEKDALQMMAETPRNMMLPGTALLIRAAAARAIGMMDDRLFAYHEDVDFCIRAEKANIGRRLVKEASMFHDHTPDERLAPHVAYYLARNGFLLWRKHASLIGFLRRIRWDFASLQRMVRHYGSDVEIADARRLGWWHGLLGIGGEMRHTPKVPYILCKLTSAPKR